MIEVINLSKSFQNNKAVNNINFDIGENEIIGLLGPNGCGKTTTIAMILGLLKPTKGKILINKKNIENHRIELLHKMSWAERLPVCSLLLGFFLALDGVRCSE